MRIAFISNHPAPYRDEFLARLSAAGTFEVDIYNLFSYDSGHAFWALESPRYRMKTIAKYGEFSLIIFFKLVHIVFGKYGLVVLPGLQHWYLQVLAMLAALTFRRYALCADSVAQGSMSRIKYWIKRFVFNRAEFIFVPGNASVNFFMSEFGVPRDRLQKGLYALDGNALENEIFRHRQDRDALCAHWGIQASDTVFLMVANMIKTRHYPIIVNAFARFAEKGKGCRLVIVGKGEEMDAMVKFSNEHPSVIVVPGCSFSELSSLYAIADVYVHGGREPASTALVIGAIAHLPLISSEAVGCSFDVVEDRMTGLLVPNYLDEEDWVSRFNEMLNNRVRWTSWGNAARCRSRCLDADVIAEEFSKRITKRNAV